MPTVTSWISSVKKNSARSRTMKCFARATPRSKLSFPTRYSTYHVKAPPVPIDDIARGEGATITVRHFNNEISGPLLREEIL